MPPEDLAHLIHRELKRLPAPRAPETLLPRVMAALHRLPARRAPVGWWYRWPVAVRALAAAGSVVLLAGVSWFWPVVQAELIGALPFGEGVRPDGLADLWRQVSALAIAAEVLWRTLLSPISVVVLPLVLVMWMACVVFGAALGRVALGGAIQS